MKIRLLSDLHMEFTPLMLNFTKHADVCILAGDIGNPYEQNYDELLLKLSLTHEKVFVITGNHEYYNNDFTVDHHIKQLCSEYDNVHFLQKDFFIYKNVKFIGCTLWSAVNDPTLCKYMSDFKYIQNFTFENYNDFHQDHKAWLEEQLADVVITHHLPSKTLIHESYQDNPLNVFYASDMTIKNVSHWCYGHTHYTNHTIVNNVKLHCNPRGYAHKGEQSGFDLDYIFEI